MWPTMSPTSARQGAEVTLTTVFASTRCSQQARGRARLSEGITIMGGWMPVACSGADGRATGLRVMQCEAKMVGGRLDIKNIEGTEKDIPADLIVSAIGQAVDFTGLEVFNNGKGAINSDKNYQVQGQARRLRGRRRGPSAPADHRHRPRRHRRRRHRPFLPARKRWRSAPRSTCTAST
jgi:NADPH-dependent glutamate synthase beta subunit-like oxidoreductase